MKKHGILILFLLVVVGSGAFFFLAPEYGSDLAPTEDLEISLVPVEVVPVVRTDIQEYLRLNGDVRSSSTVDVLPDTSGRLVGINARVGEFVQQDQVLGSVDSSRPGATFVASPIRAPISGTITRILGEIGSTVTQTIPVFQISQLNSLEILAQVPERDVWRVVTGLSVSIRSIATEGRTLSGRVAEVSPVIDSRSRTMEITINVADSNRVLKSGMLTDLTVLTRRYSNVLAVPQEVIIQRSGQSSVFVIDEEGLSHLRAVELGVTVDGLVQITSGLEEGDRAVISGQSLLVDGTQTEIIATREPLGVR